MNLLEASAQGVLLQIKTIYKNNAEMPNQGSNGSENYV